MISSPRHRKRIQARCNDSVRVMFPHLDFEVWTMPAPAKRYPCQWLTTTMRFSLPFPTTVSDAYPQEGQLFQDGSICVRPPPNCMDYVTLELVRSWVKEWDATIRTGLASIGFSNYSEQHPWNQNTSGFSYVLAVGHPPIYPEHEFEAKAYGHWMSTAQRQRFNEETGRYPFLDEAWITDRYIGINVFRSADLKDLRMYV